MKSLIRSLILVLFSTLLSLLLQIKPDTTFVSTIFNVSGIMFSLGLGLVVTFSMSGVKNMSYVKTIRKELYSVRRSFLMLFLFATCSFFFDQILRNSGFEAIDFKFLGKQMHMNLLVFPCVFMSYSIVYFIVNFFAIHKLNNDIFDKTNE
jgi:hypothetical protein